MNEAIIGRNQQIVDLKQLQILNFPKKSRWQLKRNQRPKSSS